MYHTYLVKPLGHIINLIFSTAKIPEAWKEAIITPVHKSGEKNLLTNYRPISLINNFAKIFEKCLKKRLNNYLDKNKILNNRQFGFRSNLSTEDGVVELAKRVVYGVDEDKKCLAIFLDLAKAFDTVDHEILIGKLAKIGIRGHGLEIFVDYLANRKQKVKINGTLSDFKIITTGVPQGTVLGPTLFLLYINSISDMIGPDNDVFSYADDTALLFQGKSWEEVYTSAETGLKKMKSWLNANRLSLNIKKTKFMTFTLTVSDQPEKDKLIIHSNSCNKKPCDCPSIDRVNDIKYLGIVVDQHLRWNKHIEYVVKRLRRLIYKFYQLRDILNKKTLIITYKALAESIIRYGIIIWGGLYNVTLRNLEVMQNTIIKIICKKERQYSTEILYQEVDLLSVRKLYTYESLLWMFKIQMHTLEHNYNTRWNENTAVEIPLFHKSHSQRFIFFFGPKLYNKLPKNIKSIKKKEKYKVELKKFVNTNYPLLSKLF